jgi:hypothetical protein
MSLPRKALLLVASILMALMLAMLASPPAGAQQAGIGDISTETTIGNPDVRAIGNPDLRAFSLRPGPPVCLHCPSALAGLEVVAS